MPPSGTDAGAEVWARLDGDGWRREGRENGVRISLRLPCDPVVGPWRVSLNYDDAAVESCDVGLPSLRFVAWELEDPDLAQLRTRLEGKSRPRKNADDDPFEWGVERLLHLCGLQTVRHPEKQATDIIAFEGDLLALFAECTVIAPDDDKINKLADRAEKFRNALREHGRSSAKLLKAVFTPVEQARVSAATRKAAYEQRGVVIVCREEMELLLDMARRGESAAHVTAFLAVLPIMHGLRH